jgi:hypothetical protein
METIFSFAEFKSLFGDSKLKIAPQTLRKSYRGLNRLRKHKNLSWQKMRERAHAVVNELQVQLLKPGGHVKAARIPLTEQDWERIGSP